MEDTETKRLLNTLAQQMRGRRHELGMTQEQLAESSGLSTNFVARLELGLKTPSFATLVCLARALRSSVPALLEETGDGTRDLVAEEISRSLAELDEGDAEFALRQFRSTVGYLSERSR